MRRITLVVIGLVCALGVAVWRAAPPSQGGDTPLLFTAAGQISDIAVAPDGTLWAATRGGLVHWDAAGTPEIWTTTSGLPVNDLRAVATDTDGCWVASAAALCRIDAARDVNVCTPEHIGEIRDLQVVAGVLLVAASTGVYRLQDDTCTRLRAGDARRLVVALGTTWVVTDRHLVRLRDGASAQLPDVRGNVTALAADGQQILLATALGCWRFNGAGWTTVPLPQGSLGSHISALAHDGHTLLAAVYGDGLYRFANNRWTRLQTPSACRRVTTLASNGHIILAGTQEDGLWSDAGGAWKARRMPPAIPCSDIYGLTVYHGALWASTFDQGLLCRTREGWRRVRQQDGLSSDAPRDLVVFHNRLYVRYSTGEADCYDGKQWRTAFTKTEVPRQGVYAMATDGVRLYLGQWAGWVATDGTRWEHHYTEPGLKDQVITAVHPQGTVLWLGTQKAGLFRWQEGALTHYHEGHGLTDDWITSLAVQQGHLLVGTYTGGLLSWDGQRFAGCLDTEGFAIRDLAVTADGSTVAATPLGVYLQDAGAWRLLAPQQAGGLESQTLLAMPDGLWVGTRTALAYVPIGRKP